MAVAAHDRRTGQRKALFGADDMDNALFGVGVADIADAERGRVGLQRGQLLRAFMILDRDARTGGIAPRGGRQVVIGHRQRQIGAPHFAPGQPQGLERLRAGHFVHQMTIDINQTRAVIAAFNDMGVPDFLVQCAGCGRAHACRVSLATR